MSNALTVAQLERMLARKRTKLDGLVKRQDRLQRQLATVEQQITSIGGKASTGPTRRGRGRRPKNDQPLIAVVVEILAKHPKGLTLKELAAMVLATGYKTFSDKFENTLYQCLYHNMKQLAHDADTRTYRLKQRTPKKRTAEPKVAKGASE